jgi:hypothetical protein
MSYVTPRSWLVVVGLRFGTGLRNGRGHSLYGSWHIMADRTRTVTPHAIFPFLEFFVAALKTAAFVGIGLLGGCLGESAAVSKVCLTQELKLR